MFGDYLIYVSRNYCVHTLAVIDFLPSELKSRFLQIKELDERSQGQCFKKLPT